MHLAPAALLLCTPVCLGRSVGIAIVTLIGVSYSNSLMLHLQYENGPSDLRHPTRSQCVERVKLRGWGSLSRCSTLLAGDGDLLDLQVRVFLLGVHGLPRIECNLYLAFESALEHEDDVLVLGSARTLYALRLGRVGRGSSHLDILQWF